MEKDSKINYFLLMDGLDKEAIIYQYMDFDYLLALLENKQYYVNAKEVFEDKNEAFLPKRKLFGFTIVGANATNTSKEYIIEKAEDLGIRYYHSKEWFTSCWTKKTKEDILMWKTYTSKCGVRIKSSIHNFIASINVSENFFPICGAISYDGYSSSSFWGCAFSKDVYYENEQEIRFYFLSEETTLNKRFINLKVDPTVMIDEVTISPFVRIEAAMQMKEMLENKYFISSSLSKIVI